jgi:hypothetical protein
MTQAIMCIIRMIQVSLIYSLEMDFSLKKKKILYLKERSVTLILLIVQQILQNLDLQRRKEQGPIKRYSLTKIFQMEWSVKYTWLERILA